MSRALPPLRGGHHLELIEGSRALFPSMIAAIDEAHEEILVETYIYDFTGASADVTYALERAARRGVAVRIVVDGAGTPDAPSAWMHRLEAAGVQWRVYSPLGPLGLLLPGQWRRLHRKLCVVDRRIGFCGGINVLDDFHDPNHGPLEAPRFDFSLRVEGPLVTDMRNTMLRLWQRIEAVSALRHARLGGALESWRASGLRPRGGRLPAAPDGHAKAALLLRDNVRHRAVIEKAYLRAIGRAHHEVIIANAYFVPGGRMRRALVRAARRGVKVILLLQGRYEYFMQYYASRPVFGALLRAGAEIHEYSPSFLHAKVAVVDGRWATVGSSNLDPLSLLLAREANVVVEDEAFAGALRERLLAALRDEGQRMDAQEFANRPAASRFKEWVALVLMRIALIIQGKKYL